jgi:catechol 2,3-dioxygenase-like lactoylglutathione lyase family enzyme
MASRNRDPGLQLQPTIYVADLATSIGFYQQLGGEIIHGDLDSDWVLMQLGNVQIALVDRPSEAGYGVDRAEATRPAIRPATARAEGGSAGTGEAEEGPADDDFTESGRAESAWTKDGSTGSDLAEDGSAEERWSEGGSAETAPARTGPNGSGRGRGGVVELHFGAVMPLDQLEQQLHRAGFPVAEVTTDRDFGEQLEVRTPEGLLIKISQRERDY